MTNRPCFIQKKIYLAPMAGVTDKPFRILCREMRADARVSEMTSANPAVPASRKSQVRREESHDRQIQRALEFFSDERRRRAA